MTLTYVIGREQHLVCIKLPALVQLSVTSCMHARQIQILRTDINTSLWFKSLLFLLKMNVSPRVDLRVELYVS